jgi:SAM-dependent methyltransferase
MHREEVATARAGRTVREVVTAHQLALVRRAVPRPARVLDVGCGKGELAAAMAAAGHRVTGIDPDLPDDMPAVRNATFERVTIERYGLPVAFDTSSGGSGSAVAGERFTAAEPFDAIVFGASLHHVEHLGVVLDRAVKLLAPGGVLVVDEFDLRAPDEAAALWFFEIQEMFAVAGLYDPARIDGSAAEAPVARWLAAHAGHHTGGRTTAAGHKDHAQQLHSGAAMIEAIEARFDAVSVFGGSYLYRYVAKGLRGPRAPWIAEAIKEAEERRITLGVMPAVGIQLVAKARSA